MNAKSKAMKVATYARARLWTGIAGVGTVVVVAVLLLVLGTPAALLEGRGGSPPADALWLAALLGLAAVVLLPFDVLGGLVLPRRFRRPAPSLPRFALGWLRGVLVLVALSSVHGTLLLAAGRAGGRPAALAAFVGIAVLMVLLQERLARWIGGLRRVPGSAAPLDQDRVVLLSGADPGFSGGFSGLSGTLVVPAAWAERLTAPALELLVARRRTILASGAWRRSLVLAVLWNAAGFLLASFLPNAGVGSVAELVTTALGFSLWTFLGLLLLPTPSRSATLAADGAIATDPDRRERLQEVIRVLDSLQDDEPERSAELESVFHPVPSVGGRLRALDERRERPAGAWHLARTALYLSHAGLSLLPRVVHCNVGRPELWVYLPSDG